MSNIQIVPYNKKAFILIGQTSPHRESIKRLGGRWSRNLRRSIHKRAWVFSNSKLRLVQDWIKTLLPVPYSPIKRDSKRKRVESDLSLASSDITIIDTCPQCEVVFEEPNNLYVAFLTFLLILAILAIVKNVQIQTRTMDDYYKIYRNFQSLICPAIDKVYMYNPLVFLSEKLNESISLKDL